MQSKRSFFNVHLYKKNLKRFWVVWGSMTLIMFFVMLLTLSNQDNYFPALEKIDIQGKIAIQLTSGLLSFSLGFIYIFAPIVAMCVQAYLYKSNSVSFYHSLPITRFEHFGTALVSGLSMFLIPIITGILVVLFTGLSYGVNIAVPACIWLLSSVEFALFYFGFALLCGYIAGQILVLPVLYLVFTLYVDVMQYPINSLFEYIFFGYFSNLVSSSKAGVLAPIDYMADIAGGYEYLYRNVNPMYDGFHFSYKLIVIILLALVFFMASYFLNRKRHSETAGDTIAIKKLSSLFVWIAATTFSLMFSYLFISMLPMAQNGSGFNKIVVYLVILVFALIGFFGFWMLQKKTFKVFKPKAKEALLYGLTITILYLGILFVLFRYESFIPDEKEIKSITVDESGNSLEISDKKRIAMALEIQRYLIDHKQEIMENNLKAVNIDTSYSVLHCEFVYQYGNSKTANRSYSIYITDNTDNTMLKELSEMYDRLYAANPLAAILGSETINVTAIKGGSITLFPDEPSLTNYIELTSVQAQQIAEALVRDIQLGNISFKKLNKFRFYLTSEVEEEIYGPESEKLGYFSFELENPYNDYYKYAEYSISEENIEVLKALAETGYYYNSIIDRPENK